MTAYTSDVLVGPGRGLRFTESPRWRGDRVWFIDIHDSAIKSVSLAGELRTEIALPFKPNGLGFAPDGAYMAWVEADVTWQTVGPAATQACSCRCSRPGTAAAGA